MRRRTSLAALILTLAAGVAEANEDEARARWRANQDRIHAAAALVRASASDPFVPADLTLKSVRLFADSQGNQVVVGEVVGPTDSFRRNLYPRAIFRFYDAAGTQVGMDAAYVEGPRNFRAGDSATFTTGMQSSGVGFFKLWTTLPAAAIATYTFSSDALGNTLGRSPSSDLTVSPITLSEGAAAPVTFRGTVLRPQQFSPRLTTFVRVSVAGYLNGVINDVEYAYVQGRPHRNSCDLSANDYALARGDSAPFAGSFSRPVDSIGPVSLSFAEEGPSETDEIFTGYYDHQLFNRIEMILPCGFTFESSVPWLRSVRPLTGKSVEIVELHVEHNTAPTERRGIVKLSGYEIVVRQRGEPAHCGYSFHFRGRPQARPAGGSGIVEVAAPSNCVWVAVAVSEELLVPSEQESGNGLAVFYADRNLSRVPRTLAMRIAGRLVEFPQGGMLSRELDVNRDNHPDLLWQHRGDGRLSAWLLDETTQLGGPPLEPERVEDVTWEIAGAGDLDADGAIEIIWRNTADGRVAAWFMDGVALRRGEPLSIPAVPDVDWRISAVGDLNGDFRADLIWQHERDGRLAAWLMSGTTVLAAESLTPGQVADTNWRIVGSSHSYFSVSESTVLHLFWHNRETGALARWEMDGTVLTPGTARRVFVDPIGPDWRIRAFTDVDLDGNPEIVLQNVIDGRVEVWFDETSTTPGLKVRLLTVPDTNWTIVGPK